MPEAQESQLFRDHFSRTGLTDEDSRRRVGEPAQAIFRLLLLPVALLYVGGLTLFGNPDSTVHPALAHVEHAPLIVMALLALSSGLLSSWVLLQRGLAPGLRGVVTYVHDFGGLSVFLIASGPEYYLMLLPILWQTLGTGLRFGRRAMMTATCCAVLAYAAAAAFSPYWPQEHALWVMLIVNLLVPPYVYVLAKANERSVTRATAAERDLAVQREAALTAELAKGQAEHQGRHQAVVAMANALRGPSDAARKSLRLLRAQLPRGLHADMVDEAVAHIDDASRALSDLEGLDDFLSGEPMVDPIRQELQQLLADPLSRLRTQATSVGASLSITLAEELPTWVEVDPHRLRQVVSLALSAIIQRHAKSHLDISIFVAPTKDDPSRCELRFDLAGKPALSELDHAEDPALMLATRTLAVAGGHAAWFPVAGVDFRLSLPVRVLPELAEPSSIQALVAEAENLPWAIVVDDHMSMRSLLTTQLKARGYRVVSTSKADVAERLFADKQPKLVVTDQVMPRTTGLELIERLRAADPLHQCRFVLVTAHLSDDVREKAASLDVSLVPKPISAQRLDQALGNRQVA